MSCWNIRLCSKLICGGAAAASILGHSTFIRAENLDRFYMSGQAAMQAGAITADSTDGGSIWYNPAGLARMRGQRFDVNVSAYALRIGGSPGFNSDVPGAVQQDLKTIDFSAVPAGAAFTKRLNDWTLGFGIFVPKMEIRSARSHIVVPETDEAPAIDFSVDAHEVSQSLFAGPSFGIHLGPGVDFGMSLFINYRSLLSTNDAGVSASIADKDVLSVYTHQLDDWLEFGLTSTMGTQIAFTEQLHLGMTLRLPTLRVFQILDRSEISSTSTLGSIDHSSDYNETLNIPLRLLYPPRLSTGISYQFERTRVAFELDLQSALSNSEIDEYLRPLANLRLGARHRLQSGVSIGGGFFTNLSANREPTEIGDQQINYYGLTFATELGTAYEVSRRGEEKLDPPGHLTFGTTFALSYALGLGSVMHAQVGYDPTDQSLFRNMPLDVVAHEWILSVGSSLIE